MPITRAEAMAQVAGGQTRLNESNASLRGQGGLRDLRAQRPGHYRRRIASPWFDNVGPSTINPSMVGPDGLEIR